MEHSKRPLDMLLRQLAANRSAARYRNKETGQRHFCHLTTYVRAFVEDTLKLRAAIKELRKEMA